MKGLLLLLFVTFCVVVPFAFSSRLLTDSSSDVVVVDVQGKELKMGEPYYALSQGTVHVEGLCLKDLKNETSSSCPHDVIQCTVFDQPLVGLPIIFSNSSSAANLTADSGGNSTEDAFVTENTFYTIKFKVEDNNNSSCDGDTTWGLGKGSDDNSKIVTTDPADKAVEFQISREGLGYKISYCITIPLPHIPICYPIGFIQDGFNSRLGVGVGIQPVEFVFATKPGRVKKHATS
nr:kunitz trypsin inhibitor [Ipomoea batatas]